MSTPLRRADKPFISVNCAAIPETCSNPNCSATRRARSPAPSRGASANSRKPTAARCCSTKSAKWTCAAGQAAARHPGARDRPRRRHQAGPVDIRIIATSNRDLADAAKRGTFREDLLYRLNVVNLRLPALRERPRDILALARHFAHKYAEANGVPFRPSPPTERLLISHPWRGNVRELENTMHRAVLLASGSEIMPEAIRLPDGTLVGTRARPTCRAR
jgi:two-component system, response regulator FlrC